MKRIFLTGLLVFTTLLTSFLINDLALARSHSHLHFGIVIAPPVILWAPYPYYYQPWYPPPPPPPYYREWVPGHWEWRWDPYWRRWEKVWVPGYWDYRDDP